MDLHDGVVIPSTARRMQCRLGPTITTNSQQSGGNVGNSPGIRIIYFDIT